MSEPRTSHGIQRLLRAGALGASLLGAAACAPVPRPQVLSEVDAVRGGAAATEASSFAPGAYAAAEKLRKEANAAFTAGDNAGSQILGERALAAYAHAQALSRIARAEAGADAAQASLAASKKDFGGLDAEQARLAAEADALELKVRVARDAQPIQPSGRADPERERARAAAAKALALQARLLCAAARLLQSAPPPPPAAALGAGPVPDPKQLEEASAALAKVEAQLGVGDGAKPPTGPAPIDEATRARAGCLAALTAVRRAATSVTLAPGAGDALLTELSAMGTLSPSRDDRGVFVALRGVFDGRGALVPAAAASSGRSPPRTPRSRWRSSSTTRSPSPRATRPRSAPAARPSPRPSPPPRAAPGSRRSSRGTPRPSSILPAPIGPATPASRSCSSPPKRFE